MKNNILALATGIALAAGTLLPDRAGAALPTYKSATAWGNAGTGATAWLPSDPHSQIRVVGVQYSSDTASASLGFNSGTTAFYQTATNVLTSSVTNQINSTNGLSVGAVIVLQQAGVIYTNTVATWNQTANAGPYGGTNVVLNAGGWGVIAQPGSDIYLMGTATSWPVGATTNAINGDAIYVGAYGRPVEVYLPPATASNRLYIVTAHYDSASQP
jgi:hypothetical protein